MFTTVKARMLEVFRFRMYFFFGTVCFVFAIFVLQLSISRSSREGSIPSGPG